LERGMSRLQKKAEGRTKQIVGQMIGDDRLVNEGKEEARSADDNEHAGEPPQNDGNRKE
jgi:uncharacterized protein YjbJ (UPF0337 family)